MTENAPGWKPLAERREQFLEAISGYSEDRWAAGWLIGIEGGGMTCTCRAGTISGPSGVVIR